MCGVMIEEKDEARLKAMKVKDSKLLTKIQREDLFDKIKDIAKSFEIISTYPEEVDKAVNGDDGLNLNKLEAVKTAEIINKLNPEKAIIDAPSNNIKSYKEYLSNLIKNKKIKLILEHKADLNYVIVGAASILAKVTRDREIELIKKRIKVDFGSGYMADPKTANFLEKYHEEHAELFRKSWMPYKKMKEKKFQSNLDDFSNSVK
jgi:ribonuclease HII